MTKASGLVCKRVQNHLLRDDSFAGMQGTCTVKYLVQCHWNQLCGLRKQRHVCIRCFRMICSKMIIIKLLALLKVMTFSYLEFYNSVMYQNCSYQKYSLPLYTIFVQKFKRKFYLSFSVYLSSFCQGNVFFVGVRAGRKLSFPLQDITYVQRQK